MIQDTEYLGRLVPGMDVCDMDGKKIGTLARVYRDARAPVLAGAEGGTSPGGDLAPGVMEVKTGLLGLGAHLFVPVNAIHDATEQGIFLNRGKSSLPDDWRRKPENIDELT